MSLQYLVLSGELSGEGCWCTASTYDGLVSRVQEVWGSDFRPVFKYKLASSPIGATEECRYYQSATGESGSPDGPTMNVSASCSKPVGVVDATSSIAPTEAAHIDNSHHRLVQEVEEAWKHGARGSPHYKGQMKHSEVATTGMCWVVLDDEADFDIWLSGGARLQQAEHCHETLHHAMYHASDNPLVNPLTNKVFAFRKTTLQAPQHLCHDKDVLSGSYHAYYSTVTRRDGVFRFRSSPAVKHTEDDVVRLPIHTLLPPMVLIKLGVSVVLRHSAASELILWTGKAAVAGGVVGWGHLVHKARSAWGVHHPVFRYLDLTQGVMQMNITCATDFAQWEKGVGSDRHELVVLEQAPACDDRYDAYLRDARLHHLRAHPPGSAAETLSLPHLLQKLDLLEQGPSAKQISDRPSSFVPSTSPYRAGLPLHTVGMKPSIPFLARCAEEDGAAVSYHRLGMTMPHIPLHDTGADHTSSGESVPLPLRPTVVGTCIEQPTTESTKVGGTMACTCLPQVGMGQMAYFQSGTSGRPSHALRSIIQGINEGHFGPKFTTEGALTLPAEDLLGKAERERRQAAHHHEMLAERFRHRQRWLALPKSTAPAVSTFASPP